MIFNVSRLFRCEKFLVLFLLSFVVPGYAQTGATLIGIVSNSAGGSPITGTKITVGTHSTYSFFGGIYSLTVSPVGTYPVNCTKAGFSDFTSAPFTFIAGNTTSLSITLSEIPEPPFFVAAAVDSSFSYTPVNISWQVPRGPYEILYDDGIQDDFTVWAVQGNMNAVRFTPVAYPATVTGGRINIGKASDYAPGSIPFVPFQVSVYDATGPGGRPGTQIAGPYVVIPSDYGWVDFSISSPPLISSGNFYLVMIQGGNAPNAAGLAIDQTNPQLRSYSHFVTSGNNPWVPAAGNFMIRALVYGPGGPLNMEDSRGNISDYEVYRLRQGEEQNPFIWSPVGSGTATTIIDNSWPALPCGPYRWAVKAVYSGNVFSSASFSNIIGKCWTVTVTVHVTLSCDSSSLAGVVVRLVNLVYPDTSYSRAIDPLGNALFHHFWKGTYQMSVSRFGYQDYTQSVSISTDTSFSVLLLQLKNPPSDLFVNGSSLMAHWNKPFQVTDLLNETWQSGSFLTNSWTVGGQNWMISSAIGYPMPSAMFSWSPPAVNYDESIVSRAITGLNSPILRLKYDVFLSNYGTTSLNQLAVEIWDGVSWHLLRNYTNSQGNIPWTSQDLDISAFSALTFKVRFRAYGTDSYDINNWNIDNIRISGSENPAATGECVLGYNFYLNNILNGYTQDTFYHIPGNAVQYGSSYNACVVAVYGSGLSLSSCYTFNSQYLVPPGNLQGTGTQDTARLTWDQPALTQKGTSVAPVLPPGLTGYIIFRDGVFLDSLKNAGYVSYSDPGLYPGNYHYKVAAVYDLSPYGFPGLTAQSYPAGPVSVKILYGRHLPFSENWEQETFTANGWGFDPDQGNWILSTSVGNPSPGVQFLWNPARTNYSYSLLSPVLDASSLTCARLWIDFDYRLQDNTSTGNEHLSVEIFYNNIWHVLSSYDNSNTGSWKSQHLDITPVKGKAFSFRFRAYGQNSADIRSWDIDNINVYAVCKPPRQLDGSSTGGSVRLTWKPPQCEDGYPLNEGFEETFFPPEHWNRIISNSNATWSHSPSTTPIGVHTGAFAAGLNWDYSHQDEWLIAQDVEITGDLQFWSYTFQGSAHLDHYYIKLSEDEGITWQILLDMSALPAYPSASGYNEWTTPYTISLSSHIGQVVDIAWQAVDGDGQGLWYPWAIDDCSVNPGRVRTPVLPRSDGSYNIYRQDPGSAGFNLLNSFPVPDTEYLDQGLATATYRYYVTAFSTDCSFSTSSDTIFVDVLAGTSFQDNRTLLLYPNPARDLVTVKSSNPVKSVEIINYTGQVIYCKNGINSNETYIDVSDLLQGVYFFKITLQAGIRTVKVSIGR